MKVILQEDVSNLGSIGQMVDVRRGYARNYLFPQGLAVEAGGRSAAKLQHQQRLIEARLAKRRATAVDVKRAIERLSVSIPVLSGEGEKLYGSVTNRDIEEALAHYDIVVDRRKIALGDPIKQIGVYEVDIRLHTDVTAKLKIWVVKKDMG